MHVHGNIWNSLADVTTIPVFPGSSRKMDFCPGVPETY